MHKFVTKCTMNTLQRTRKTFVFGLVPSSVMYVYSLQLPIMNERHFLKNFRLRFYFAPSFSISRVHLRTHTHTRTHIVNWLGIILLFLLLYSLLRFVFLLPFLCVLTRFLSSIFLLLSNRLIFFYFFYFFFYLHVCI